MYKGLREDHRLQMEIMERQQRLNEINAQAQMIVAQQQGYMPCQFTPQQQYQLPQFSQVMPPCQITTEKKKSKPSGVMKKINKAKGKPQKKAKKGKIAKAKEQKKEKTKDKTKDKTKEKKPLTPWNLFFAQGMKRLETRTDLSQQQKVRIIATEWKDCKLAGGQECPPSKKDIKNNPNALVQPLP
jgi:hypothetical protein